MRTLTQMIERLIMRDQDATRQALNRLRNGASEAWLWDGRKWQEIRPARAK